MAATKNIKLFKLASEINIGKDAIVDYLQKKGFDIVNKPTSQLTPDMVEAVYDKFKRERRAAEVQREKLEKHRQFRRSVSKDTNKKDKAAEAKAEPETEKKASEKAPEPEVKKEEKVKEQEPVAEETQKEAAEPIEDKEKKAKKPEKKAEEVEVKEEKPAETVKEEEPQAEEVEAKKEEEKHAKHAVKKKETKAKTGKPKKKEEEPEKVEEKVEAKKEVKPAAKKEKPKQEKPEAGKKAEEKLEAEKESEQEVEEVEDKEAPTKRRKKKKRLVEVDLDSEFDDVNLRGLKVVGKIELGEEKQRSAKGKKRKESEEDVRDKTRKAKAKKKDRKKKEEVKAKEEQPKPPKDKKEEKKKRKRKKSIREQISQEDVEKAIKETMAGMESHHQASQRTKFRQKKKAERAEKEQKLSEEKEKESHRLQLTEFVTTSDLANLMNVGANEIIVKCMKLGLMVTINQRLDKDTIALIADDYGYEVEFVDQKSFEMIDEEEDVEENLEPRSPIVTIMGHVDHGKTSLLDFIRRENVVAGEAGGITQHIAAYRVELPEEKYITFLDTPGHEAFTAMRARGAQITDIVVLVVAADDSVMPQTLEAISHAQAAKVPIVVAINKIDKPDANPDRIKQQLADQSILVEDWGGSFQSVELSAKSGDNVDQLLDKILLESEMLELKADPVRKARGVVIESHMSKGMGNIATVIVQKGTLHIGDTFVSGIYSGKVRAMFDERGKKVDIAGPSIPVGVVGFDGLPEAGDILTSTDNESEARRIANERQQLRREQELRQIRHITLDDISKQIQIGGIKDLNLVIKGDVTGSVEALSDSLMKLSTDEVRVQILHKSVGTVKESDVMLAAASGGVIIGFNVGSTAQSRKIAERESVEIRDYNIIYDCINDVQLALEGLLTPDYQEEVTSTVEIRKVFKISKLGNVAGCYVKEGKIIRNDKVRVLRDGLSVYDGSIDTLKREKDDVKEVDQGFECGVQLAGFNDIKEGDIIEGYKVKEVKRTLESSQ